MIAIAQDWSRNRSENNLTIDAIEGLRYSSEGCFAFVRCKTETCEEASKTGVGEEIERD